MKGKTHKNTWKNYYQRSNIQHKMKLTNKSYIFLLLFFFIGCVAKKSTIEHKERIVKDTIYKELIKTVFKPVKEVLYVDSPCDSLGALKTFEKTLIANKTKVKLYSDKNLIKVEVNIDSIIESKQKEFKSNYQSKVEIKEVIKIKYRYPIWLILTSLISVSLLVIMLKNKFL